MLILTKGQVTFGPLAFAVVLDFQVDMCDRQSDTQVKHSERVMWSGDRDTGTIIILIPMAAPGVMRLSRQ